MKRKFLFLAVFCVLAGQLPLAAASFGRTSQQQEAAATALPSFRHEFQFKLGPASDLVLFLSIFGISYNGRISSEDILFLSIPAFTVDYTYNITARHAIGGTFSLFLIVPSTMFKYRFTYKQTPKVRMYGSVALGARSLAYINIGGFPLFPSAQLVPFGVQFGGGKGFFVMETGIGTEGSLLILGGGFRF